MSEVNDIFGACETSILDDCKIVQAKDVEAGDVIFTNSGEEKGVQACILVSSKKEIHLGLGVMVIEFEGLSVCSAPDDPEPVEKLMPITLGFRDTTNVGVIRGHSHTF